MAGAIVPQVDLGSLGLRGFSSFSSLLAAISADNVTHTAVAQMEQLGSMFLVSGKHADRLPDLLQRSASVRLDRLKVDVGWRKGDTASIMAQSAGGQSIALMSLVLISIYRLEAVGEILKGLSRRLLAQGADLASIEQLVSVAKILESKVAPLGFGNFLAQQTMFYHKLLGAGGRWAPIGILEVVSSETMIDLLEHISKALREDKSVVRISGTYSVCYILATVMMMFPRDTLIRFNGTVVADGARKLPSIIVELEDEDSNDFHKTHNVDLEMRLEQANGLSLPIILKDAPDRQINQLPTFKWQGWVSDVLTINYLSIGLDEPRQVLEACCNMLCSLVLYTVGGEESLSSPPIGSGQKLGDSTRKRKWFEDQHPSAREAAIGNIYKAYKALIASLEEHAWHRISRCCELLTGMTPTKPNQPIRTSYLGLCDAFEASRKPRKCVCSIPCTVRRAFDTVENSVANRAIYGRKLGPNSVITQSLGMLENGQRPLGRGHPVTQSKRTLRALDFVDTILGFGHLKEYSYACQLPRYIHQSIIMLFAPFYHENTLAGEDIALEESAQVILPATLTTLELSQYNKAQYCVLEGRLMVHGTQYSAIRCVATKLQHYAEDDLCSYGEMLPSNIGQHSSLQVTIKETLGPLELRAEARCSNRDIGFDLSRTIPHSFLAKEARPCPHDPKRPLDPSLRKKVFATSVEASTSRRKLVSIAMTKGNPQAQLLCCADEEMILARDCCLTCAYHQLVNDPDRDPEKNMKIIVC